MTQKNLLKRSSDRKPYCIPYTSNAILILMPLASSQSARNSLSLPVNPREANPLPPALGNTPTVKPSFGGSAALTQFAINTLGTTLPKVVVARTPMQMAEDVFLQLVEDSAICFSVGLSAKHWFAPLIHKLYKLPKSISVEDLGKNMSVLGSKATPELIAGKTGVLAASTMLMWGAVCLTPFLKNFLSTKIFHTKNFSAIAGLEGRKDKLDADERDPVELAKKRFKPILGGLAAALLASIALPKLVMNNKTALNAAKALLKAMDFGKNKPFELSKPIVVSVFGVGFLSYVDSARDMLEKLEIATRLAFIFPYQAIGKELTGNWLGKFFQNQTVGGANTGIAPFKISDKVKFIDNALFKKESALDFNRVRSAKDVFEDVKKLNLPTAVATQINRFHTFSELGAFAVSAGLVGSGISLLAFAQTRARFNQKKKEKLQEEAAQAAKMNTPQFPKVSPGPHLAYGAPQPSGSVSGFTAFQSFKPPPHSVIAT